MGIFIDNVDRDNSIIWALQVLNTENLPSLLEDEKNLALLRADGGEEYLDWHVMRSVFPEGEEVFREKLADGNKVLRLLASKGIYIDGIGPDIEGWSLVNLKVEDGEEKVCWEIMKGALWLAPSPEALKLMLAEGGDPSIRDSFGHSALHYLAEHPDDYFRPAEMIRILLEKGTYKSYEISNALHAALWSIDFKRNGALVAQILADEFVKRGLTLDEGLEETLDARLKYCPITAEPFFEEMSAFVHGESKLSSSELELMAAAFEGDPSAIDEALSRKPAPNVNAQTGHWKYTPLMLLTTHCKNIEALRRLLKAGADPNIQDLAGKTPLFWTGMERKSEIKFAELLIKNGADPAIADNNGDTPFTTIFWQEEFDWGSIELAYLFMDNGADVDTLNSCGRTPLAECCLRLEKDLFTFQMCRLLLENGAFPNAQDMNGDTPLMFLALRPDARLMRDLIKYGADTAVEDIKGNTALSIFLNGKTRDPDMLRMLTHKGAFIGSNDSEPVKDEKQDQDTNDFLLKAICDYDVDEVRRILSEEELWITLSEELCWHFVVNNVPEPEAGDFRAKLSRGAEILRLLHEQDEDIPVEDYKGRELSYIAATWNRYVEDYETEPYASDELSLHRHAASPMALREIMTNDEPEEPGDNDENDEEEEFLARASRMFSPEDFVTSEQVRNSLTPEDFIDDYSEYDDDDEDNTNILHILAKYWKEYYDPSGMIRTAAELGEDIHAKNDYGKTPLELAADECSVLCTRALLDLGCTLDEEAGNGETLRSFLNTDQYTDPDKFLAAVFDDSMFNKSYSQQCIMFIEVMRTILCGRGRANDDLLASVNDGDTRRIREALAQGADVNVRTLRGYTPLMTALILGHTEAVNILLEHGADVNATDMFGHVTAAFTSDIKILRLLIEKGADINKPSLDGEPPVVIAAKNKNYKQVKALLKAGADPMSLKEID